MELVNNKYWLWWIAFKNKIRLCKSSYLGSDYLSWQYHFIEDGC